MRVTAAEKSATLQRIRSAGRKLFSSQGFDATTTRDVAQAAGIAAGTLFNYFPTKESLAAALVLDSLAAAKAEWESKRREGESLAETLFAYVAIGLRRLRPHRKYVRPVIDTADMPIADDGNGDKTSLAEQLLAPIEEVLSAAAQTEGRAGHMSPLAPQLFSTLHVGLLSAWAADTSPKQEQSLALVDHATRMFADWFCSQCERPAAPAPPTTICSPSNTGAEP